MFKPVGMAAGGPGLAACRGRIFMAEGACGVQERLVAVQRKEKQGGRPLIALMHWHSTLPRIHAANWQRMEPLVGFEPTT